MTATLLASRCICNWCDAACQYRPFKPCCGACMDGTPYEQESVTWPLGGSR